MAVAEAAAPVRHELRKTVTVVFADLVDSMRLQERLDSESVRRVIARFYDAARGAVEAHEGRVVKFTGDGVMAVFGTPVVREDDALRAVRAAAALVERLLDHVGGTAAADERLAQLAQLGPREHHEQERYLAGPLDEVLDEVEEGRLPPCGHRGPPPRRPL